MGKRYDVDYDFDLFFSHLDANNDGVITTAELGDLLTRFTSSGGCRSARTHVSYSVKKIQANSVK